MMRPRLWTGIVLIALGCLLPGTAGAQVSARLSTRDIPAAEQARDTLYRYALCLVGARRGRVERALAIRDEAERGAELGRIATSHCLLEGRIQMGEPLLRGALYRALYLKDFGEAGTGELRVSSSPDEVSNDPLGAFGNCVMSIAPDSVRAFVVARPITPEEDVALNALMPNLAGCVAPGDKVKFNRAMLQAILAEALYKTSIAGRPAPMAAAK